VSEYVWVCAGVGVCTNVCAY